MVKRAIVTGGTGFIGSKLCQKLLEQAWQIAIITRKKSNYANIKEIKDQIKIFKYDGDIGNLINFFRAEGAEVVFHLASFFVAEHKSAQIDQLLKSNLQLGLHILEAMKESRTKLIINTGTSWQHYDGNPYNPVCLYAATKEAFEKLMTYYIEAENVRAITLKLFDTYGEDDQRGKLINLLSRFSGEQKILEMSPGEQWLDLVHVEDVVEAFIKAYQYLKLETTIKHKIYGVSSGQRVTLKELIGLFESSSGKKIEIIWGGRGYRKREVMRLWNDFAILPNWRAKIILEEGLKRFKN